MQTESDEIAYACICVHMHCISLHMRAYAAHMRICTHTAISVATRVNSAVRQGHTNTAVHGHPQPSLVGNTNLVVLVDLVGHGPGIFIF